MDIENKCRIDYEYRLSEKSPIIIKTISSNIVSTQIIENTLEVSKTVNKKETYYFDILTYTIVICNVSSFTITNLKFQDSIEGNTRFIKNSLRIDGVKIRCINPEEGFYVGDLKTGARVVITFKVLVLPTDLCRNIKNSATAEYDYIYNVEKPPIKVNKESNKVRIKCEKILFTQILVGHTLKTNSCIDKIKRTKYKLKIFETKLINTHELNFCRALVMGKIECEIWYKSKSNIRYVEDVFGFSAFILVPVGISYSNKEEVKAVIEYASTDLISADTVFINASLLLYY